MGCCFSTNHGGRPDVQLPSESLKCNRAPPPPSIDEETVKEVLSETPNFVKPTPHQEQEQEQEDELKKQKNTHIVSDKNPNENSIKNDMKLIFKEEEIVSEKENSEVCSLSISETVSTATFDYGCNEDEGEVKQRVKRSPAAKLPARNRSISGDFGQRRDRVVGKSPNRRIDQSPDKRNNAGRGGGGGSVKLVQSKESSSGTYQAGRRGLRPDPYRKDQGAGSGRRSRSPATNRSTMGRSPSARRINGSPGRVRTDPPDGKWAGTSDAGGTQNESLENPLVSLECFIFL